MSVYGPFDSRVLVEMSAETAASMFPDGALGAAGRAFVADAAVRDVEALRPRAPELADSVLAASLIAMALEIEHPFNSATSKSYCQARLVDTMEKLLALAPPEEKKGELHAIKSGRAIRLGSGGSAG